MKIDSHHHFWKYNEAEYGWIDDRMAVLKRDFLPDDLEHCLLESGFSGSVAVQARQTTEETRWLLNLAGKHDFIKGVVGWVDLCSEDKLRRQLDEFCKSPEFIGVRHVIHDEPDDGFMLRDDFLKGISILKDYDLTYDLLLFPKHIPLAQMVVSMFPDQKFVVDHIAKPLIKDRISEPWRDDIRMLAENKNVWCKLSGMVTEADWKKSTSKDFRPWLDVVFDAFGTDRLMVGSDWPVCLVSRKYPDVINIVKDYISGMPDVARQKILGLNCIEFYSLGKK